MKNQGLIQGIAAFSILIIGFFIASKDAQAETIPEHLCLIIVSGSGGYSSYETGKALSFYDHLIDASIYTEEEIVFLANLSVPNVDGFPTVSNIEEAFDWLEESSFPDTEIVIYIFDHEQWIDNETFFRFDDGNISSSTIDALIDQIICDKLTMILNGERSALAGPDLVGSNRDIICSMGANQANFPDSFNITRSLEDPEADLNQDNIVDYIEAYWKEVEWLQGSGQDPVLYGP
jgi:hypothetical protein